MEELLIYQLLAIAAWSLTVGLYAWHKKVSLDDAEAWFDKVMDFVRQKDDTPEGHREWMATQFAEFRQWWMENKAPQDELPDIPDNYK